MEYTLYMTYRHLSGSLTTLAKFVTYGGHWVALGLIAVVMIAQSLFGHVHSTLDSDPQFITNTCAQDFVCR